jgi:hypothetical protein
LIKSIGKTRLICSDFLIETKQTKKEKEKMTTLVNIVSESFVPDTTTSVRELVYSGDVKVGDYIHLKSRGTFNRVARVSRFPKTTRITLDVVVGDDGRTMPQNFTYFHSRTTFVATSMYGPIVHAGLGEQDRRGSFCTIIRKDAMTKLLTPTVTVVADETNDAAANAVVDK